MPAQINQTTRKMADLEPPEIWAKRMADTHTLVELRGVVLEGLYAFCEEMEKLPTLEEREAGIQVYRDRFKALRAEINKIDDVHTLTMERKSFKAPPLRERPEPGLYIALIPLNDDTGRVMSMDTQVEIRDNTTKDLRELKGIWRRTIDPITKAKYDLRMRWVGHQRDAWTKYLTRRKEKKMKKKYEKRREEREYLEKAINAMLDNA